MNLKYSELEISNKLLIPSIIGIIFSALFFRLYVFPFDLPITQDAFLYFFYAIDTMLLGEFPKSYTFPNSGWPMFLSAIFPVFDLNSAMQFMTIQRFTSTFFSLITVIPIFFLARKFFGKNLSLLCTIFFIFEPRIIQNSFSGLTDPLYIFLTTSSLALFLSENKKIVCIGFILISLISIVRYEGLILLIPYSIMFFIKFRKTGKKLIFQYILILLISFLIILPFAYLRYETTGSDGFTSIISGPRYIVETSSNSSVADHKSLLEFFSYGIVGMTKFLGWSMIPSFIIFVPIGFLLFFKKFDNKKITILLYSFFLILPAFYAYTRELTDIRYLLVLYPIFSLFSIFFIDFIMKKISKKNFLVVLIIAGLLVSSALFLYIKLPDYEHEKESLEIARYIIENTKIINEYFPETEKLIYVKLEYTDFPTLSSKTAINHNLPPIDKIVTLLDPLKVTEIESTPLYKEQPKFLSESVVDYIEITRNYGLTHIVTDGNNANPEILNDLFIDENRYPFAIKEFDSSDLGYNYHVKIFKIDYDKFDQFLIEK
ncbi:hypothetical protein OAK02_01590 [Candidatus Nitrosopelagicus sp.]|nr:hypothetical protein [Candidatus Nitrosopelagicus sp.]